MEAPDGAAVQSWMMEVGMGDGLTVPACCGETVATRSLLQFLPCFSAEQAVFLAAAAAVAVVHCFAAV